MGMRTLRVCLALTAPVLWSGAGALSAQQSKANMGANRTGQWLGFGLGVGWSRLSCEVCEANRGASISGYFRVGGTLNPRFLLGLETDGWMRTVEDVDHLMLGVAAELYYYPNPRKRLFYKAGLGIMLYQADDGPGRITSQAFGPNLGLGYDLPASGSVSFTPFASVFIASLGVDINFNGEQYRADGGLMLLQLGMGVTWH